MVPVPPETRAQIARRRLADLTAAFDASLSDHDVSDRDETDHDETVPHQKDDRGPTRTWGRRLGPAHVRFAAVATGIAAVLIVWWLLSARPHEVEVPTAAVTVSGAEPTATEAVGELVIDVAGRVRRPGIVTLPVGSRVHEAITAAGGVKGKADTTGLNLARVLNDGEQVLVGAPPGAPAGGSPGTLPAPTAVNLNTADLVALDTLPGVGPVTAEAIVSWREENGPFRSVDDLLEVKGIGEATLADLRDLVTV